MVPFKREKERERERIKYETWECMWSHMKNGAKVG